jgi:hypothetical protein
MRVGEQGTPLRQRIDVRRLDLGVAFETAHPVVQIVNRDEQYIGALLSEDSGLKNRSQGKNCPND